MKNLNLISLLIIIISISACSSTPNDPLEDYNRAMYKTNKAIDKYTLKPISKGYKAITPDPVENSISNFFNNIAEINTFANSLLQGKLKNAALSSSRLVWNTTLGLGGLFDVASGMGIETNQEDFGQTLRTWGVPAGPYFVLPLLGPSTVTDSIGLAADYVISPVSNWDWSDHRIAASAIGLSIIDTRTSLLALEKVLESASSDEYTFVKSGYLQRRAALTRDGAADASLEDDFDALFDEEDSESN